MPDSTRAAAAFAVVAALAGCNLYSSLDSPSNDAQYLAAARACFDEGDYACAKEYYAKIESTDYDDVKAAELATVKLEEAGISISTFKDLITSASGSTTGTSASTSSSGTKNATADLFSTIAGLVGSPSKTTRVLIFEAYLAGISIKDTNKPLRGLIRLLASFALIGEIFGEDSLVDGKAGYTGADLVTDLTACKDAGALSLDSTASLNKSCIGSVGRTNCGKPSGALIEVGTSVTVDKMTAAEMGSGNPTFFMVTDLISMVGKAFEEMGATGSGNPFSGVTELSSALTTDLTKNVDQKQLDFINNNLTLLGLTEKIDISSPAKMDPCYRWALASSLF